MVQSLPANPNPKGRQRVALSVSSTLPLQKHKTASKLAVPCDKYRMVEAEATGNEPAISRPIRAVHLSSGAGVFTTHFTLRSQSTRPGLMEFCRHPSPLYAVRGEPRSGEWCVRGVDVGCKQTFQPAPISVSALPPIPPAPPRRGGGVESRWSRPRPALPRKPQTSRHR